MPLDRHVILYSGSVKNVRAHTLDTLIFEFTDQVSVFDWGALPDPIPGKGKSLVTMGALFFEALSSPVRWKDFYARSGSLAWIMRNQSALVMLEKFCSQGMKTHFRGILNDDELAGGLGLIVERVNVVHPEWLEDHSTRSIRTPKYSSRRRAGELIPLEVVFRFKLVGGSSILKRRKDLKIGDTFSEPLTEFFTKLEPQDRYLPETEALQVSGLTQDKFSELKTATQLIAAFLQFIFGQIDTGDGGIELIDGKFEWAISSSGELMLVDSIGPDELRLLKNGKDLSKETLREYYRTTDWYKELSVVKEEAAKEGDANWKLKVKTETPRIPSDGIKQVAQAYFGLADDLEKLIGHSSKPINGDRVILIGSGGREHALAYRVLLSPSSNSLIWPTQNETAVMQLKNLFPNKLIRVWDEVSSSGDLKLLADRAKKEGATFAIIGPDAYLEAGATDIFIAAGIPTFGPTHLAAQLEWSKSFAKEVMLNAGVPTAKSWNFTSTEEVMALLKTLDWSKKWVIKADTLAAGKGVEICNSFSEAERALQRLATISRKWVIEEFLEGTEVSLFAFCDGDVACLFEPARDFKTLNDDQHGPNTGGMGAITPVSDLNPRVVQTALDVVFRPILREMKKRGTPYQGLLYAGLMIAKNSSDYCVLEFNARFGDPETQALLPRFKGDFLMWLKASAEKTLSKFPSLAPFDKNYSAYVVAAASGYPDQPKKGDEIFGLDPLLQCDFPALFVSGVKKDGNHFHTNGGRVLGTLGVSSDPQIATQIAYATLSKINFQGMHFRNDIGPVQRKIVVLASGRGSNFEAIAKAIYSKKLNAKIAAVICNRKNALVFEKAKALNIEAVFAPKEEDVLKALKGINPEFIVLAGYDRIISSDFIDQFRNTKGESKIINIHPSLLPEHKGLNAYETAFKSGAKKTGVSIHRVEPELDSGPILAQREFLIHECKTTEEVESIGLKIEHELYPETLAKLFREES